jgi:thiamine biosynthesis lipoprotein
MALKNSRSRWAALTLLSINILLVDCLLIGNVHAEWYNDKRAIMGTAISVELWADDADTAHAAIEAVMQEMVRIDNAMSPWIETSELALINREATQHPLKISPEMMLLLKTSLHYSEISAGAFDISFASVGYMYDYRRHIEPSKQEIASHLSAIDYRSIKLDASASTVHFMKPGMRIDLGGIAKGYAVDQGANILIARGIKNAIVTAGGDSRIVGDRRGRPWMVGIKDPRVADKVAVLLPLSDTAMSTSGDYERYFMDGERRVHHIINPRTGTSATGIRSVSVLTAHGIDSDALTKPLFILGVERGMAIIDKIPGVDAIVIDDQGQMYYSKNLQPPAQK